jgi:hypothetical protein
MPNLLKLLTTLVILAFPYISKELGGYFVTAYMVITDVDTLKIIASAIKSAMGPAENIMDSIEKNPEFSLFFQHKNALEIAAKVIIAYLSSCLVVLLSNYFTSNNQSVKPRSSKR